MNDEQKADYERAAVALENGMHQDQITGQAGEVAIAAFMLADQLLAPEDGTPETDEAACDNLAARLLRECIEKGEELK